MYTYITYRDQFQLVKHAYTIISLFPLTLKMRLFMKPRRITPLQKIIMSHEKEEKV